jgi:hypothetical protein
MDRQQITELIEEVSVDPSQAYFRLTPREKSAFWRMILQDEFGNPAPVEMVRVKKGNSQTSPGCWVVVKSPFPS